MPKTILLVDDDQDDIDLFKEALEAVTHDSKLLTACDGSEALRLVMDGQVEPDHVFLDINMPVMNGIEWLEELTKLKKIPPPHVTIYTTSNKGFRGYDRCIQLGATYLQKPTSYYGLIDTLKNKLEEGSSIQESQPPRGQSQ